MTSSFYDIPQKIPNSERWYKQDRRLMPKGSVNTKASSYNCSWQTWSYLLVTSSWRHEQLESIRSQNDILRFVREIVLSSVKTCSMMRKSTAMEYFWTRDKATKPLMKFKNQLTPRTHVQICLGGGQKLMFLKCRFTLKNWLITK